MTRRKNEEINADEIRLIHPEQGDLGKVPIKEALDKAEEINLDLVEVDSSNSPPICKLMESKEDESK